MTDDRRTSAGRPVPDAPREDLIAKMEQEAREWRGHDPVNRRVARRLEYFANKLRQLSGAPAGAVPDALPALREVMALQARADEVQREMVRYCAGIDRWDAMPVVVEGWLRVFEDLQEALAGAAAPLTSQRIVDECIGCFMIGDGAYEVEDGPGPFCSLCWEKLEEHFRGAAAPLRHEQEQTEQEPEEKKERQE